MNPIDRLRHRLFHAVTGDIDECLDDFPKISEDADLIFLLGALLIDADSQKLADLCGVSLAAADCIQTRLLMAVFCQLTPRAEAA
jgi:hypothetical protein